MSSNKYKTVIFAKRLEKYAAEGKSVTYMADGKTLFVKGGVPGDVVDILVKKNKSSYAEGVVLKLIKPSPDRVDPFCRHFGICGGCKWQMLPYMLQLTYKQQQVFDQLTRLCKVPLPSIENIIGCDRDRLYRNKLEFTFSAIRFLTPKEMAEKNDNLSNFRPALGFHAPGRFDKVVDIDTCWLQPEPTNKIKNLLRQWAVESGLPFYNSRTKEGWWRNAIIRITTMGEVMVNLIVKNENPIIEEMLKRLLDAVPEITSLHYTLNDKLNDTIYDLPVHTFAGNGFIEEKLGDFRFRISPKSFFQTNSFQAEKLYKVVKDFAGLTGSETVYDLYCGTGSIGIFLSHNAGRIVGIETVADAVKDARVNASLNNCDNCQFFTGDVAKVVQPDFIAENGAPDVVIVDPPRPGLGDKLVNEMNRMRVPKVVYVSCNPATQARDLQGLDAVYSVRKIQPLDMFPQTHHIENVVLLTLKSPSSATK